MLLVLHWEMFKISVWSYFYTAFIMAGFYICCCICMYIYVKNFVMVRDFQDGVGKKGKTIFSLITLNYQTSCGPL